MVRFDRVVNQYRQQYHQQFIMEPEESTSNTPNPIINPNTSATPRKYAVVQVLPVYVALNLPRKY